MPANTRIKNQRVPVLLPSTIGALIPNWTWPRAYYGPGTDLPPTVPAQYTTSLPILNL